MRVILAVVVLILGVGAVIFFGARDGGGPAKNPLEFGPMDEDLASLPALRAKEFGALSSQWQESAAWRHSVCNWVMYDVASGLGDLEQAQAWHDKLVANTHDVVAMDGVRAHFWLGESVFSYFLKCYREKTKECTDVLNQCEVLLGLEHEGERKPGGAFSEFAMGEGMLDAQGEILQTKAELVHLLFRYLWVQATQELLVRESVFLPQEQGAIIRWQLEQSLLGVDKKLKLLEKYRTQYPGLYDYDYAQAVILQNAARPAQARAVLEQALARADERGDGARVLQLKAWLLSLESLDKD